MIRSNLFPTRLLAAACLAFLTAAVPALADETGESASPGAAEGAETAGDETEAAGEGEARPRKFFEELLVVGSEEAAWRIPGSAHVVTPEELERQEHSDVHRILRQVPGVNIQEEDGYGLRPNIGIRGTGVDRSQKVTLLEDGVLVAPAPYSAPSAYYSPTAGRMESMEVRKGSGSIRQGPYTNGGAINYVSTSIPASLSGRVRLAAGAESTARAHASLGDSGDRFGWLVETYQLETDGFKRLDGGGDTGFQLEDYLGKLRFNSRPGARVYQAFELKLGKTEQDGDETYLGLTQADFDRDPYRRYASSAGDNIRTNHEQVQLSYFAQPSERFHLTATVYRNDFFRDWFKLENVGGSSVAGVLANPQDSPDLVAVLRGEADSEPGALGVRHNRRDYDSRGVQAVLSWRLGAGRSHDLSLGVRYHEDQEDRFQEEDRYRMLGGARVFNALGVPGSHANRVAEAEALAVFVEDTFGIGRFTLTPGVRVESIDLLRRDFGREDPERTGADLVLRENRLTEVIPGLGASLALDDRSILFAGVHRGFAPPSPGSTREVDAEESLNWELGWRRRDDGWDAEVLGFFNGYDNLLGNDTVASGGAGLGDQFNGGEVEVLGVEASFGTDLAGGTRLGVRVPLRLAYTFTRAEFRDTFETSFADWAPRVEAGDRLPYIPEHQLYLGLSAETDRWGLHLDVSYADETRTHAGRGPIPAGEAIDARWLVDLRAEVRVYERLKLWGQVLNATDEVYVAARRPAGLRPGRPLAALVGISFDVAAPKRRGGP